MSTSELQWILRGKVPTLSGAPERDLVSEKNVVVNRRRQIHFWSRLNCAMNHTYNVCQFERQFCKSAKLQFVVRIVKHHLVLCELHRLTQYTTPEPTWPPHRNRRRMKKVENANASGHIWQLLLCERRAKGFDYWFLVGCLFTVLYFISFMTETFLSRNAPFKRDQN